MLEMVGLTFTLFVALFSVLSFDVKGLITSDFCIAVCQGRHCISLDFLACLQVLRCECVAMLKA